MCIAKQNPHPHPCKHCREWFHLNGLLMFTPTSRLGFVTVGFLLFILLQVFHERISGLTFLTVSICHGEPLGNANNPGMPADLLSREHIVNETMHWNQVMNSGASKATAWLLSNVLFTKTVVIDTAL